MQYVQSPAQGIDFLELIVVFGSSLVTHFTLQDWHLLDKFLTYVLHLFQIYDSVRNQGKCILTKFVFVFDLVCLAYQVAFYLEKIESYDLDRHTGNQTLEYIKLGIVTSFAVLTILRCFEQTSFLDMPYTIMIQQAPQMEESMKMQTMPMQAMPIQTMPMQTMPMQKMVTLR
jgi:hypothetical protein